MTVLNEQKLAFRDMTKEERSEIVEAWLSGEVQGYIPNTGEWEDRGPVDFIYTLQAYRTKPKQLVIPWEIIKKEYKWAELQGKTVWVYKQDPATCSPDDLEPVGLFALDIDISGIDPANSLTQRPEGM